jgi:outer membrane lipoprotein-sorting protein
MNPFRSTAPTGLALAGALTIGLTMASAAAGRDAGPSPTSERDATDPTARWLAHARDCLRGKFSLEADFTLEQLHPLGGALPVEEGTVQLRRGGRLRLEYRTPRRRLLVSDGDTIRAYDPQAKVVYESPARRGPLPLAFAFALEAGAADRFTARWIGGAADPDGDSPGVIELLPAAPNPLASRVLLTLAPGCPSLVRITVIDQADVAHRITLANQRFNRGIGARRFRLTVPPGVRVVTP